MLVNNFRVIYSCALGAFHDRTFSYPSIHQKHLKEYQFLAGLNFNAKFRKKYPDKTECHLIEKFKSLSKVE